MSDHSELKRLAEKAKSEFPAWYTVDQLRFRAVDEAEFVFSASPDAVLGLIAENERIADLNHKQFGDAIRKNAEFDQLKAENEALRKDAERYRWLRRTECWEDATRGGPWIVNSRDETQNQDGEALDVAIDAAMSKEG